MKREDMLARLSADRRWDLLIVGGGATGLGIAVDAAARGYRVLLAERGDFAQGTSSRSTKLIHGGVRYLQQGNLALVREALRERALLQRNAPHLVHELSFILPSYAWWESSFYGAGLKLYDLLAGEQGFGASRALSAAEVTAALPSLRRQGLRGGILYHDAQFDDARLAIHLALTAAGQGATLINYCEVVALTRDAGGRIGGAVLRDAESGQEHSVRARAVINAAGPFCDAVRRLADPGLPAMIAPSQGVHLVLDRDFLPGDAALVVPRTADGRVLFAIPWLGRTLLGTTDTPVPEALAEPRASYVEIDFILATANRYLSRQAAYGDVRSVFVGIRPLVKGGAGTSTARLSRDHVLVEEPGSGLITITGGKWTTYRRMAEDTVDFAAARAGLPARACPTYDLPIHRGGALAGSERLHPRLELGAAQVIHACREEMARRVEDVLARRSRALLLDAEAAAAATPAVARLLAAELGRDAEWERKETRAFQALAKSCRMAACP